jgi:hypothetical protein
VLDAIANWIGQFVGVAWWGDVVAEQDRHRPVRFRPELAFREEGLVCFAEELGWVFGTISATGCSWACRPAKRHENRRFDRMAGAGSGEVEISHGASEAEQLFDPERA